MRFTMAVIAVFLLFCSVIAQAENQRVNDLSYEFSNLDNIYTFRGSFLIQADPACLIHVLYDFEHLKKFVTGADSIDVVRQGANWYEVCYTYRSLFFKNKYTYRKTLHQDQQKVTFEMTASEQHGLLSPVIIYSTGYYEIKREEKGYRVEYLQTNKMESNLLKGIYLRMASKEAVKFLQGLKEYAERTCH